MREDKNHIEDYLLARWLAGDASEEEVKQVEKWGALSEKNQELLNDSDKLIEAIKELNVMESVDSKKAFNKVKDKIQEKNTGLKNFIKHWQKIAAIVLLPLLAYNLLHLLEINPLKPQKQLVWNEISTSVGMRSTFTLPDGTKVWLNGNTYLKYPMEFKRKERLVELQGEAYFDVTSNKKRPFVVDAGELMVQAVGTSFNVTAYKEDTKIETALTEGKVNLLKDTGKGRRQLTSLQPGQLAVFDKTSKKMQRFQGNLNKYVAWRSGKILFQNDSLEEVVRKLGHWYNVKFQVSDDIDGNYAYTGAFQGESLHQILDYIELTTPVKFEFSAPVQNQDTTFQKRIIYVNMK